MARKETPEPSGETITNFRGEPYEQGGLRYTGPAGEGRGDGLGRLTMCGTDAGRRGSGSGT